VTRQSEFKKAVVAIRLDQVIDAFEGVK